LLDFVAPYHFFQSGLKPYLLLTPGVRQKKRNMPDFKQAIMDVEKKCAALLKSPRHKINNLPKGMPLAGIYLFSEKGQTLYVGRTNNLHKRLQYHTRNNHNQATFAFLLAREKTGKTKASYQKPGSRSDLLNDPEFRTAFDLARDRIKNMDVQFIEEPNPIRQALLEICAAIRAKSKYNDFDNH
jgi:hypothetical protein